MVRAFLDRRHLQFLRTTEEFLIGDVPAVPILHDEPRLGLSSGVGVDRADSVVMPLGLHLYVVTDPHNAAIGAIPPGRVAYLNRIQIAVARDEVYFHPESGLEDFVRAEAARE